MREITPLGMTLRRSASREWHLKEAFRLGVEVARHRDAAKRLEAEEREAERDRRP